ncbi:PREDICTED: mesothelin isoform X6 [Chinchilla lanigera]|uniref:mesothelin isoform X6 n=1 Tax=Chinchilla lanigera TaxID=34839 RepID=UPI0006986005|nr:PREDICTED: mesothelin isoform X6 [Chinchilla lanigera]
MSVGKSCWTGHLGCGPISHTMAFSTARLPLRSCRILTHSSLLLLLSLGWVQPLWAQTVMTQQTPNLLNPVLASKNDLASLDPSLLCDFTCTEVSGMSIERAQELAMTIRQKNVTLRVDQLHCLALHLSKHLVPKNLDSFPVDMLPFFNPASRWSVSTLDALQNLLAVLDQSIIRTIPKGVTDAWLHHTSQEPFGQWPELTTILVRLKRSAEEKVCPPGRKPQVVEEDLFFYADWELEACVDGALLATQMDRVNAIPFTYQQLHIFKRKLDETYPQGYPESLILSLGHFFHLMSPEDIQKWNVTSLDTLKALLKVSKRPNMDTKVVTLTARYLQGSGQLDKDILDALAGFYPTYLCALSPEQLGSVPARLLWEARPQDLDTCNSKQLVVLYPKARLAFQNVSGLEYFKKIQPFLGGASIEDLQALSHQNVSMDMATFKKLPVKAVERLTVAEVQNLLGRNVAGLKAEERNSPVKEWIFQQRQEDLDMLGLRLRGGIPNGYMVLDLNSRREAFSGGPHLLAPGLVLALTRAVLVAGTLN